MTFRRGGNLLIEDGQGRIRSIFLEDGFLDFLNKVYLMNIIVIIVCSIHT